MSEIEKSEIQTLVVERVFPHPVEKLWRALTESPLLARWLMDNDFGPIEGRHFQFRNEPVANWNGIVDCEVLTVKHLRQLSYTWNSAGLHSTVLWVLTPEGTSTRVRMEQTGFRADQQAAYKGASYGWNKFLTSLESVLVTMQ